MTISNLDLDRIDARIGNEDLAYIDPSDGSTTYTYNGIKWDGLEKTTKYFKGSIDLDLDEEKQSIKAIEVTEEESLNHPVQLYISEMGIFVQSTQIEYNDKTDIEFAAVNTLRNLSMDGIIENVQPDADIPPPDLWLYISDFFADKIDGFELVENDGELVLRAVISGDIDPTELLDEIRLHSGISYPKPDRIETISETSELDSSREGV